MKGTVKWFDAQKGFGFLIPEDGTKDVYAHFSDILGDGYRTLHEGDRVSFTVTENDRGRRAAGIIILEHAPKRFHD